MVSGCVGTTLFCIAKRWSSPAGFMVRVSRHPAFAMSMLGLCWGIGLAGQWGWADTVQLETPLRRGSVIPPLLGETHRPAPGRKIPTSATPAADP